MRRSILIGRTAVLLVMSVACGNSRESEPPHLPEPVNLEQLQRMFPDFEGWSKVTRSAEYRSEKLEGHFRPLEYPIAKVDYIKAPDVITAELFDCARCLTGFGRLLKAGGGSPKIKRFTINGNPAFGEGSTKLTIVAEERFLLKLEGSVEGLEILRQLAARVDFKRPAATK